ncbi:MFS transporter [Devosia sp. CN2-171]|jgi:MFS transporter, DHA1 family, inner membrane transport protein|uniref:MFS transporter n=1 Tax=Devosia sp. CN2-171 TaxID=3400909 RepID=UPI003BF7F285
MPFAIYALAIAAFAIGSAEFVISGLLPLLAGDLSVSIPVAGLLVTAYAAGVAIGGPLLTILTSRYSQRTVLIGVMALFTVAQVLCAIAPDYGLLLVARLLSSIAHGAFFGAGNIVVANLVPPERRGRAFSLFISGITIANLLGLPGGSAIGLNFGWRTTFLTVALLGAIATVVLILRIPNTRAPGERSATLLAQARELRHQKVWLSYLTITFVMVGTLAFGTYQVPIMEEVTGIAPGIVPIYLLIGGLGSVLGIYLGGRGTDWKPMPTLITVLLLQALFFFTMLFAMHDQVWMTVNLLITSILGFAFSTPLQARVITAAQAAPNLASSLISTAFNIGIAAGAATGAALIAAGVSYADIPIVGVISSLLAAGTATISWLLERSEQASATTQA